MGGTSRERVTALTPSFRVPPFPRSPVPIISPSSCISREDELGLLGQHPLEELPGVRVGQRGDLFRWPFGDDLPAELHALRAQVNDPVRRFADVQVWLND